MKELNKGMIERVCEICGDHIGLGYDHSECSKAKKELYGDSCENKKPKKKMDKKSVEYLSRIYR